MDDLPMEVLTQILKFLNFADRRECALVCKKFYEASLDPELHWNSTYIFDAHALLLDDGFPVEEDGNGFYCKSPNLFIHNLEENISVRSLLNPHRNDVSVLGPHVIRLSLKGSSILESSFVEILKQCESLESLDITRCNSFFMTGLFLKQIDRYEAVAKVLEKTASLNLSSIRYLNDDILKTFITLCPNLSFLSLAACNILFSEFGSTQQCALTFPCILNLISLRVSTLTRIDLSCTGCLSNDSVEELSSLKGLKLREVVFQNCRELGDSGIITLAKKQHTLKVVDIRGCYEVGNSGVSAICSCLSNLRELYLAKCRKVTDASASKISFLEKLRILDITECYGVTTKSISVILSSSSRLITLIANGCDFEKFHDSMSQDQSFDVRKKTGVSLIKETMYFDNLTTLSINSGRHVTDSMIQSVFLHFKNLEDLSMSWCQHITDRGLLGLDTSMSGRNDVSQNLEKNNAHILSTGRYSSTHGRNGFLHSPGSEYFSYVDWNDIDVKSCLLNRGIIKLQKLRRLYLSNCPNITDESLIRIFCVCSPTFSILEKLELNMMPRSMTDDVVNGISIGCPLLTKLAISCSNVTDKAIDSVTSRMHRLESLNLSNCDYITPKIFNGLIKNTKWLRELDISSCKQIPVSSADRLRKSLSLLVKIHTRYSGV